MKHKIVGNELNAAALKYQRQHPEVTYQQALEAAMADNATLAKEFAAEFGHISSRTAKQYGLEDAGDEDAGTIAAEKEIDKLTLAYMREHPTEKDYGKALQIVLARHPDLKMRWTKKYNPDVNKFSSNFEHVVTVEYDEKEASRALDALVKKIQKENPDWTIEECVGEAKKRLKAKGERIDELSEEMQTIHARLREHIAS